MLAQFLQHPLDGVVFPPPAKERIETGIAQPLEEMKAVERGVKVPAAAGSKELSVVFVEASDQRVFQESADFLIHIESQVVDARGGFPRLLYGKKLAEFVLNDFPVFLAGAQSFA